MSKHTPELWRTVSDDETGIVAALANTGDDRRVLFGQPRQLGEREQAEADIGRAVACVNALAGIDDPAAFVTAARVLLAACELRGYRPGESIAEQACLDAADAFRAVLGKE